MVDLIVLNYNDADTVFEFIGFTQKYSQIDHTVIVDNASSDDSYERLQALGSDRIHVIRADDNLGYAGGNNLGIRYALEHFDSEYVIISNPDVFFEERIIPVMRDALMQRDAACVACKMICNTQVMPVAWKLPTYKDCVLEQLLILSKIFHLGTGYRIKELIGDIAEVEVLPGSLFMADTAKLQEVGFFDENTFLYYEENILGYRLRSKGYKQLIILNESYDHKHSVSIDKSMKSLSHKFEIAYKSRNYYCRQYLRINKLQAAWLKLTFRIGLFNFMLAKRIIG